MNNKQFSKLKRLQEYRAEGRRLVATSPAFARSFTRFIVEKQARQFGYVERLRRLLKLKRIPRRLRKYAKLHARRLRFAMTVSPFDFEPHADGLPYQLSNMAHVQQLMRYHKIPENAFAVRDNGISGFDLYVPEEHVAAVNADAQQLRLVGCAVGVYPFPIEVTTPKGVEYIAPPGEEPPYMQPVHNRLCEVKHDAPFPTEPPPAYDPARYSKWDI